MDQADGDDAISCASASGGFNATVQDMSLPKAAALTAGLCDLASKGNRAGPAGGAWCENMGTDQQVNPTQHLHVSNWTL